MCIAVYQPPGTEKLSFNAFKAFEQQNPDGNGVAFFENGEPVIHKDLDDLEGVYDTYEFAVENDKPVVVHLRIRTVGQIVLDNCQPLKVYDDLVMAHNGTINLSGFNAEKSEKSDTVEFRDRIARQIPRHQYANDAIVELMEDYVGTSRVIFIGPGNDFLILNENYGCWNNGIWYSNLLFVNETYRHRVSTNRLGVEKAIQYTYHGFHPSAGAYGSYWTDDEDENTDKDESVDDSEVTLHFEDSDDGNGTDFIEENGWYSEEEFVEFGLRYCGEALCWSCAPKGLKERWMVPLLQSEAPHYCFLCNKNLDNANTMRHGEFNNGVYEHPQRPSVLREAS